MGDRMVLVYGGNGALGSTIISYFKKYGHRVCSIGTAINNEADANIIITKRDSLKEQHREVVDSLTAQLKGTLFRAIFCVSGGWVGGDCASQDFIDSVDTALKQSVWSSAIAASICPTFLRPGGLLGLTGSISALEGTPRMISYGMSKAAVYHMTKSLSKPGSGMPADSSTFAMLFNILDTPNNRKMMPKADRSTWTPLEFVAEVLLLWTRGICCPKSGSLIKFISKDGKTEYCYDDSA